MLNLVLSISIILIAILIIFLIIIKNKNKTNRDDETSILDVTDVGVPNMSDQKDFTYGYEKEETIVMNPIYKDNKMEENDDKIK